MQVFVAARLDRFMTHACAASGTEKYLSILLRANVSWSMLSFMVGLALGLLLGMPLCVVPWSVRLYGQRCETAVSFGASTILGCGMAILSLLLPVDRDEVVFLDIVCIDQVDEERRRQGVRDIPKTLRLSSELCVLWSPQYFASLECVYELATYTSLSREDAVKFRVTFLDVAVLTQFGWCLFMVLASFAVTASLPAPAAQRAQAALAALGGVSVAAFVYVQRRRCGELASTQAQLAAFDCRTAACMPVDRDIILSSLRETYGSHERFNALVRGGLAAWVEHRLLAPFPRYHMALFPVLPLIGALCDFVLVPTAMCATSGLTIARALTACGALAFFSCPALLKILWVMCRFGACRSRPLDALISCCAAACWLACCAATFFLALAADVGSSDLALYGSVSAALCVLVFKYDCRDAAHDLPAGGRWG